jgi:hypothetical protein
MDTGCGWRPEPGRRKVVPFSARKPAMTFKLHAVWGLPQGWGSRGYSHLRVRIVGGLEALSEAGAKSAIIDGASNL